MLTRGLGEGIVGKWKPANRGLTGQVVRLYKGGTLCLSPDLVGKWRAYTIESSGSTKQLRLYPVKVNGNKSWHDAIRRVWFSNHAAQSLLLSVRTVLVDLGIDAVKAAGIYGVRKCADGVLLIDLRKKIF